MSLSASNLALMVNPNQNSGGFMFFLFICGLIVWLITLISVIRSRDMEDVDRIIWVVVLCTLNLLGLVLYWIFAPSKRARSERELKEYFNQGGNEPERRE